VSVSLRLFSLSLSRALSALTSVWVGDAGLCRLSVAHLTIGGNGRYAKYFSNLNPVLDGAGVGGFDMEEELETAMKGSTTANTRDD
jgi:hypothetical protein